MAVVKISAIYEFFKTDNASTLIKKGEKSEESNRVLNHTYDSTLGVIKGQVQASQKQQRYSVEIHLQGEKILSASCTCPNGQYECHHMASLLLHAHKNLSKTDTVNRWISPAPSKKPVVSIPEMYPAKEYQAVGRPVTDEDRNFLRDKLRSLNRFSGMYWLLQEEPSTTHECPFPTIQTIIESSSSAEEVLRKIQLNPEQILLISKTTELQRECPAWHGMRLGRLTASNFGPVIHALETNKFPKSLFSRLLGKANLDRVKSIQWGIHHEEDARVMFEAAMKMKVIPTGLWLHPSGILGASPDGLVRDDTIIEIKCPFSHRNSTREELIADTNYCLDSNGQLKSGHHYYHQIQGQLHILQRQKCYLVVWTTRVVVIVEVVNNKDWKFNIERLISFYTTHLLPKLME